MKPRVLLACPAPAGSRLGNRITAERWRSILRDLGCRVRIARAWNPDDPEHRCDLLVALHATKSAISVRSFHAQYTDRPIVVALTGTDLYRDLARPATSARTRASIEVATRLIVLQPRALRRLAPAARRKTRVVFQSAQRAPARAAAGGDRSPSVFRVTCVAHLRAVKAPFLASRAARLLPADSRIRVDHYGAALEPAFARRARREEAANPRWRWRGDRAHAAVLRALADSDVFVSTSRDEGGSSALAEALVAGVPVLATRNDGSVGMLDGSHPGLFDVGDARGLASLLSRCERDPRFLARLRRRTETLAARFFPRRERRAWRALLVELGLPAGSR